MPRNPANVFIVRMWLEDEADKADWRASVTNVKTRDKQYFRNVETLVQHLVTVAGQDPDAAERE